jgi:hypothetical protein
MPGRRLGLSKLNRDLISRSRDQIPVEFLRGQGTAIIAHLQQAFHHQQEIISEAEAEEGPVWNIFAEAKEYVNGLIETGGANPVDGRCVHAEWILYEFAEVATEDLRRATVF